MDQLVSTLRSGPIDSITIAELNALFESVDENDLDIIEKLLSVHVPLIHTLTVLMIKNCCNRESVIAFLRLIKSIRMIRELDYALFCNVDFSLALDRLVTVHACVEEAVCLFPRTLDAVLPCKSKLISSFISGPNEEYALAIAMIADRLSVEERSKILQQAVNFVDKADSGMLFALICLLVKCKGMSESQIMSIEYVTRLFRLALTDCERSESAQMLLVTVLEEYKLDEKSILLFLSQVTRLSESIERNTFFTCVKLLSCFAKNDISSKYTNEIKDILERLCRWSHGLGFESYDFVQLCDSLSGMVSENIVTECLLGCLEPCKNELLYAVDANLYSKKLRMALKLSATCPPPFKTIALLFAGSTSDSKNLAIIHEIQQVLLELAIIYHSEDFKQYQSLFAKTVNWTQNEDVQDLSTSGRRYSFINSTLDMFMNYSLLYEQCAKYKQVIDEFEQKTSQLITSQSGLQQVHHYQASAIAELERKLSNRDHEFNCLRGEADDLALQLQTFTEQCRALEEDKKRLEATIMKLTETGDKLSVQLEEKRTETSDAQAEVNRLSHMLLQEQQNNAEERRKLAAQFTEYKRRSLAEKSALTEELAVANLKNKQSSEEIIQTRNQLNSIESMLKEYQSEIHGLKCQLELREEQLRQRKTDFIQVDAVVVDENMDNVLSDLIDLISDREDFVNV